jgi:hypothetical protein
MGLAFIGLMGWLGKPHCAIATGTTADTSAVTLTQANHFRNFDFISSLHSRGNLRLNESYA